MSLEYATPAGYPDADSALVAALEAPMAEERRDVGRSEAGVLLDGVLATRARRKAAYDVAIGEYLAAMSVGAGPSRSDTSASATTRGSASGSMRGRRRSRRSSLAT